MDRSKIFWNVVKNEEDNSGEITLYGAIGSDDCEDDVVDRHVKNTLDNLKDVDHLKVYINSPGGSVSAAVAICQAIKRHKADVEIHIDGLAASAATIITCAGDKVCMPNNALFMIHNPWTIAAGDSNELNKTADVLDKFKATIINTYMEKTGLDEEVLSKLMDEETWMTAEEALAYNFIDEISGQETKIENYNNKLIVNNLSFDIGKFKNSPFKLQISNNAVNKPKEVPKTSVANNKPKEENMTKAELKEKFPDMYNEIYQEGEQAERERIKNIEDNAPAGFEDLVAKAKFEEPLNFEALAVNILREQQARDVAQNKVNAEILENIQAENGEGLARIEGADTPKNKEASFAKNILGFMKGAK